MRIFHIRHLRVSRAWHDMTHCGQAKFLLAVTSGGQHGGAKPPDLDVLLVQGDLHRHSAFFRSFHNIPYHFATLLYIWKRSTEYCGTYWQDKLCLLSSSRIGFCIIPQFKFGQTSWIWGLVDLVGVQGAHSQREERRNDDERWETQVGYDMPWFHHNLDAKSHSWNQTLWRMKANDTILLGLYSDKL